MPKANFTFPNGATVNIQGSDEEIARIIKQISGTTTTEPKKLKERKKNRSEKPTSSGPLGHVRDLAQEGFFAQKRSLGDVQKALEERGHIYAVTSISPTLVRLTRSRTLRRIKVEGNWNYVNQ